MRVYGAIRSQLTCIASLGAGTIFGICVAATASTGVDGDLKGFSPRRDSGSRISERAIHPLGGAEYQMRIIPTLDVLQKGAGVASGEFHVEVDSLMDTGVRVAYAWHIVDDYGHLIAEGLGPSVGKLAARGTYASERWRLPILRNGFYRVVVTVTSGAEPRLHVGTTSIHDWWLEVHEGELQEISNSAWHERAPGARLAREVQQ